jgi:two-component system chemotaxis response regulator CheB
METARREHPTETGSSSYGVVIVAASAGGLRSLVTFMGLLPRWFSVPIIIVQRPRTDSEATFRAMLGIQSELPIRQVEAGHFLRPGTALVVNPRHNLELQSTGALVPPERRSAPETAAAEVLISSAAATFGSRVIAVILTGADREEESWAVTVKRGGGLVIAEEHDGRTAGIPTPAIRAEAADYVMQIEEIAPFVTHMVVK